MEAYDPSLLRSKGAHRCRRKRGVRPYIRTVSSAAAVLLLASSLSALQGSPSAAGTWGHWRGPSQTGVAPGAAPVRWSDTSNIAWKIYQQVRLPKPSAIKASPVAAGGMLYFPTEEGDVVVARIAPTLDVVATNTLTDQSFVASPAVAGGDIFLRSRTHLFRVRQ